jgi:hypothetical protein
MRTMMPSDGMYAPKCESLDQARIPASSGMPRTGMPRTGMPRTGMPRIGMQSPQERIPTPVPSDEDDEEMTLDQIRWIRRFRNGGGPSTELRLGAKKFKV